MRPVLPKIDYKKVAVKDKLSKAERVFVQYLSNQKILNDIVRLREDNSISPFGFTEINELRQWRSLYPRQADFGQVYREVKRLLKKHQLPSHFNLALLDYILFGFRVQLFFGDIQQKAFLCAIAEDINIPLKEYVGSRPFKTIIVFDGASEKDIINSIRGRFSSDKDTRVRGADKHSRDVMVRYYKSKNVTEIKRLMSEFGLKQEGKMSKAELVKIFIKAKFGRTVSTATIDKTRLDV